MNNAVANGALVAIALLYGKGYFLDTLNIVTQAGDFTDADCNAANCASVLGAMQGTSILPTALTRPLHDRIYGTEMGPVKFRKAVDEKISDLAERIAKLGEQNISANGGSVRGNVLAVPRARVETQTLEHFDIDDYGGIWNREWKLEAAGRGGAGATYLDGDTLVTFPRDARPCVLIAEVTVPERRPALAFDVHADPGRPWRLDVYVDNDRLLTQVVEGAFQSSIDLASYSGRRVRIRAYQYQIEGKPPAQAYWRSIAVKSAQAGGVL
jgi:hypothetical protein